MVFSSIPFIFYFLPITLLLYFCMPKTQLKNLVLLLSSLVFYGWGEPKLLVVMVISIIQGYVLGILIEKSGDRLRKVFLAISVAISLGILVYFKYANFFVLNFNRLTGLSVATLNVALPVGISFYTFQMISYVVDVYRKEVPAQKNFLSLATYISMFPQLIAGPILRYSTVVSQIEERKVALDKIALGIRRFIIGLSKKVLIANVLGELVDRFKSGYGDSVLFFWLYAISVSLQIYFDFSGYSDMAIGLGKILGFDFMENFNYPFISSTATEFWRRWHISLGSWFRDYVYIPLGGNRVSKPRWFLNLLIVWFLTGFWHGANWNFILWGLFFGILLILEKLFLIKFFDRIQKFDKPRIISRVYVLLSVMLSFVLFDSTELSTAFYRIKCMFGFESLPLTETPLPLVSDISLYFLKSYGLILIIAMIGATPAMAGLCRKIKKNKTGQHILDWAEPVFLILLLIMVTGFIVDGSFNPFLYFRF